MPKDAILSGPDEREIAIRVPTIGRLFNSLDPSTFRDKDLDVDAEEFIVGWARELPRRARFDIVVYLPAGEASKPQAARIGEAFANYFRHRTLIAELELRELLRVGWRSLLIGLAVLALCLMSSQLVAKAVGDAVAAKVLEESLIIVGWVANWKPIEIYLYSWWPIRRRILLLRRIASAPVQVRVSSPTG